MTDTVTSVALAAEIEALRSDHAKVTAAIPLVGKAATAKAQQLAKDIVAAEERYASTIADEILAERKARLAHFTDIEVLYNPDFDNLLTVNFLIRYRRASWDYQTRMTAQKDFTCNGFTALPDDVYEYLTTVRPDAIPPAIMALAPDNAHEAFDIYLSGLRRGCFRNRIAA
ncbi:hypothetical protein [Sphingobium sp. HWE2-09]|uniref:hypothetical protein n=1 Tax=Sphingobium sp. HWE2-09 TaxID=3108390 RepID=UPI002DD1E754|nr:hypothetical protein [Sphingobium sp. HWE2-09]